MLKKPFEKFKNVFYIAFVSKMSEKFKDKNVHIINTTHIQIDEIFSLILWFEELEEINAEINTKYKNIKIYLRNPSKYSICYKKGEKNRFLGPSNRQQRKQHRNRSAPHPNASQDRAIHEKNRHSGGRIPM